MYNDFISGALVKENIKKNWLMGALCFIAYFLTGPFGLMLVSKEYDYSYYNIAQMFNNENILFCFYQCAFPVMIALAMFGYLNKVNSVNVMHAQPYSRKKLYVSNVISGIILIIVPILLTTALFVALKRPTFYIGSDYDIYTLKRVFTWMCIATINSLYVFAFSVLACMVCANGIVAFLTACGFNLLPLALCASFFLFVAETYFGASSESFENVFKYTHSIIKLVLDIDLASMIVYFAIAIVVLVACYFIYKLRKLERVGDAYVFKAVKHLIGFLFVYFFTLFFGLVFSGAWGVVAYAIGGILGFILGQMFSRKTFMIFDKDGLKNFVIYAVLICIILAGLIFDVTGYEKRVPKPENVEYVELQSWLLGQSNSTDLVAFESPEAVKAITVIHKNIVEKQDEIAKVFESTDDWGDYTWIYVDYTLKNGGRIVRDYRVPVKFITDLPEYQDIINSPEVVRGLNNFVSLDSKNMDMFIDYQNYGSDEYICQDLDKFETAMLWEALKADVIAKNDLKDGTYHGGINITETMYFASKKEADLFMKSCNYCSNIDRAYEGGNVYRAHFYVSVNDSMVNTTNWIMNNLEFEKYESK